MLRNIILLLIMGLISSRNGVSCMPKGVLVPYLSEKCTIVLYDLDSSLIKVKFKMHGNWQHSDIRII